MAGMERDRGKVYPTSCMTLVVRPGGEGKPNTAKKHINKNARNTNESKQREHKNRNGVDRGGWMGGRRPSKSTTKQTRTRKKSSTPSTPPPPPPPAARAGSARSTTTIRRLRPLPPDAGAAERRRKLVLSIHSGCDRGVEMGVISPTHSQGGTKQQQQHENTHHYCSLLENATEGGTEGRFSQPTIHQTM